MEAVLSCATPMQVGSALHRFLESIGLGAPVGDLPADLYEQRLQTSEDGGRVVRIRSSMIALVRGEDDALVNLHQRVFENRAEPKEPERGSFAAPIFRTHTLGGAVRLYEPTDRLAIAETIESALAIRAGTRWPVWACLNSLLLRKVQVPASVKRFAIHPEPYNRSISSAKRLAAAIEAKDGHCCVIVDFDDDSNRALSPLERYWSGRLAMPDRTSLSAGGAR